MVHAMRIKNGRLWYSNRYIETPKFKLERDAGQAVRIRVGEMDGGPFGMFKMFLFMF